MTFKLKRTAKTSDIVEARLTRLAADLRVRRSQAAVRLFDKRTKPMAALAA